ncbi:HNH endonuclease signature motif containing protein [[Mycobacterium] crassicus]|uniref:HNH endonuclease signature motif containing protein n=1 Tax=[Mycobacterium] crassicus TaxID=2872309 RepID=A0ABU5XCX4_9MYCO|nr:HNH endonuclease signature motif containing protein [Mycolicibacter sp. MYC098]MEB3019844.1 HNH endonuclease signature motif containing protein [Mycolicibacter sp. MYC098]
MAAGLGAVAARQQICAAFDAIDAAHELLRETSSDLVGNDFRIEVADRLETQNRVNRGLMYRIFGELADPPDGQGSITSARAALWKRLRITPREITRRFKLAARIRARRSLTGADIAPELPALAEAVESGAVGEDHIRAICEAVDVLPAAVAPEEVAKAEQRLVEHATGVDAGVVVKLGQRIADHLNPDGRFSDKDRQRRRGLTLGRQGPDGMSKLSGLLDPEARAHFEAVAAAVRPGHRVPNGPDTPVRDERSCAQRNHDAFKLAMSTALSSGKLGTHRGHPVTVIVTTTLAELNQAAHAAIDQSIPMPPPALTGGGSRLPMRDLIRLAANAIHYLAVFDDHTKRPLYLGRQKRIATAGQRLICYARDRGCTRPNCLVPGYHCEVHHANPWARGGRTNADELFFACGPDHTDASDGRQQTAVTKSGRLGWTDGTTPPQINHAHHPEELLHGDPDPPQTDVA